MWLFLLACTDPADTPEEAAPPVYGEVLSDTLIGEINDIVGDGERFFLCGEDGIQVFGTSDPYNPTFYDSYFAADPCYTGHIINNRVLFGSQAAFRSYAPNNMMVRGEYFTTYSVQAFDLSAGGDRAWLAGTDDDGQVWLEEVIYREDAAMQSMALLALDASTPVALAYLSDGILLLDDAGVLHLFNPDLEQVGQWTLDTTGRDLFMATGETAHAYISQGTGGLAIVDVGDLTSPTLSSTWPSDGGETYDVLLVGTALYIGLPGALRVLDISDATVPEPIGAYDIALPGTPTRIWVDNRYAYLVDASNGILSLVNILN